MEVATLSNESTSHSTDMELFDRKDAVSGSTEDPLIQRVSSGMKFKKVFFKELFICLSLIQANSLFIRLPCLSFLILTFLW
jgi:hypothetical protein